MALGSDNNLVRRSNGDVRTIRPNLRCRFAIPAKSKYIFTGWDVCRNFKRILYGVPALDVCELVWKIFGVVSTMWETWVVRRAITWACSICCVMRNVSAMRPILDHIIAAPTANIARDSTG